MKTYHEILLDQTASARAAWLAWKNCGTQTEPVIEVTNYSEAQEELRSQSPKAKWVRCSAPSWDPQFTYRLAPPPSTSRRLSPDDLFILRSRGVYWYVQHPSLLARDRIEAHAFCLIPGKTLPSCHFSFEGGPYVPYHDLFVIDGTFTYTATDNRIDKHYNLPI